MEQITIKNLFNNVNPLVAPIFENIKFPFEALSKIGDFIKETGAKLDPEIYENKGENIWIAKSAKVAPSASIAFTASAITSFNADRGHTYGSVWAITDNK